MVLNMMYGLMLTLSCIYVRNNNINFIHNWSVQAKWSKWSDWTVCSVSCGGGRKQRNRTCDIKVEGTSFICPGKSIQNVSCNFLECPSKDLLIYYC